MKLYVLLAQLVDARLRCMADGDKVEWKSKHEDRIRALVKEHMPSGSGFDSGTGLDLDRSNGNKLVFHTSFHHMTDGGMYDGWTEHDVVITPHLAAGFTMRITGRNRNEIKDLISQSFEHSLNQEV